MKHTWEYEIRHLAYDFCRGLVAEKIIREVKRLPGYKGWTQEQKYNEAWRRLIDAI